MKSSKRKLKLMPKEQMLLYVLSQLKNGLRGLQDCSHLLLEVLDEDVPITGDSEMISKMIQTSAVMVVRLGVTNHRAHLTWGTVIVTVPSVRPFRLSALRPSVMAEYRLRYLGLGT